MCYIIASTKNGVNKMTKDKYNTLINKIRMTSKYIDELMVMESKMCNDVDNNTLDIKVRDILEKCIDDINKIYINNEPKLTDDYITDDYITDTYRSCNDEYKAKLNSDNLDKKSSK